MGFYIGNVYIGDKERDECPLILGPMAGVCDMPYRILCAENGADLVYTEMVSAKGILYNNKNTKDLLRISPDERPVALQFFGSDPLILADMAKKVEHLDFDILDINMGCPVPKIVNNGEGSALMKNPKLIGEIVRAVSNAITKPVTVKIRKSFDNENINAVEVAKIAEANGAAAIAVHPRSGAEYYFGHSDWSVIGDVVSAVDIPVIASGDVKNYKDAKDVREQTGCAGIMIARAARGNPWIFGDIKAALRGENVPIRGTLEVRNMILRHAQMMIDFKGEFTAMREMRKHVAWYTTGFKNSAKLRLKVNEVESFEQLKGLLDEYMME